MVLLIDSDVLIDFLSEREPFTKNAKEIVKKAEEKTINAFLAAHSITNIYYILRKQYSSSERKKILMKLCQYIPAVDIGHEMIVNALANNEFKDFEDCLQAECARAVNADYIVTRNIEDYAFSKVPAILPENLLKKLETPNEKR